MKDSHWKTPLGLLALIASGAIAAHEVREAQDAGSAKDVRTTCLLPAEFPRTRMLLFGEMHGSVEAPALVGDVACAYAKDGPTALGLEIPGAEQDAIDRYLDSDGGADARAALLAGGFWTQAPDGRSSVAMLALIERMRVLRGQGLPLRVFAFDLPTEDDRDAAMAGAIRAFHAAHPDTRVVALMGNIHASQTPIARGEGTIITTASLLTDLEPSSMLLLYRSGTIWACMPGCGVHPVNSKWGADKAPGLHPSSPMAGYSATWVLESITASVPAVPGAGTESTAGAAGTGE